MKTKVLTLQRSHIKGCVLRLDRKKDSLITITDERSIKKIVDQLGQTDNGNYMGNFEIYPNYPVYYEEPRKLTEESRDKLIKNLVDHEMGIIFNITDENVEGKYLRDIFTIGFKGYNNFSDEELIEENLNQFLAENEEELIEYCDLNFELGL